MIYSRVITISQRRLIAERHGYSWRLLHVQPRSTASIIQPLVRFMMRKCVHAVMYTSRWHVSFY